jgi:hypothetical protein
MTKRRVEIEKGLFFEYEVSPHRAILARISAAPTNSLNEKALRSEGVPEIAITGMHVPFKQMRSIGPINPLKPPIDVETVLIGRALGQEVGYLYGIGFRIRDDGYVEGEFLHGIEKFGSFDEFVRSVKRRLPRLADDAKDRGRRR